MFKSIKQFRNNWWRPARYQRWSNTKFGQFLRGGPQKPAALSLEEWDEWEESEQKRSPWRYWLAEVFLDGLQDIVYWPYDFYYNLYYFIKNKYIDRPHLINTRLEPGGWYEYDYRMLHGIFSVLCDFVENNREHVDFSLTLKRKDDPWDYELGTEDDPNDQALKYQEIVYLYDWWQNREQREEEYERQWKAIFNTQHDGNKNWAIDCSLFEEKMEDDITDHLIRLMKIRRNLWS